MSGQLPTGVDLLHDPRLNKGSAFTEEERDALGLRGLLPPRVLTLDEQVVRVLENFACKPTDLEKYIFLTALLDRNETLFYRTVVDHIETMMPIIYTPTVGEACRVFGHIFRRPRGLYVSARDRGRVADSLANWPGEVDVVVVTDGERILGLGDLGANGMGIPIGKLSLYTACAGIDPSRTLPVMLDVGTDNDELIHDPLYIGLRRPRLRGEEYDELVEEFVVAVQRSFPGVLLQFEDFGTRHAFRLLNRYRDRLAAFNDDIQGTAAVALAGLLASGRISGRRLAEETLLFFGAGAAATGVAELIVSALAAEGMPTETARGHIWLMDSRGLVITGRDDLADHKRPFAQPHEPLAGLEAAVRAIRPTVLLGLSGQARAFDEPSIRAMAEQVDRPVVFALSNPTSKAECTAEQAYGWTGGRAVFASGSPFEPVEVDGRTIVPGQGNNAHVFPGLGLGVVASRTSRVTDDMFLAAARALAAEVDADALASGAVYPPLTKIRDASARIAVAVARLAFETGLAGEPEPEELDTFIRSRIYDPVYESYV